MEPRCNNCNSFTQEQAELNCVHDGCPVKAGVDESVARHKVIQEDIDANPEFIEHEIAAGDMIGIPAPEVSEQAKPVDKAFDAFYPAEGGE